MTQTQQEPLSKMPGDRTLAFLKLSSLTALRLQACESASRRWIQWIAAKKRALRNNWVSSLSFSY